MSDPADLPPEKPTHPVIVWFVVALVFWIMFGKPLGLNPEAWSPGGYFTEEGRKILMARPHG